MGELIHTNYNGIIFINRFNISDNISYTSLERESYFFCWPKSSVELYFNDGSGNDWIVIRRIGYIGQSENRDE